MKTFQVLLRMPILLFRNILQVTQMEYRNSIHPPNLHLSSNIMLIRSILLLILLHHAHHIILKRKSQDLLKPLIYLNLKTSLGKLQDPAKPLVCPTFAHQPVESPRSKLQNIQKLSSRLSLIIFQVLLIFLGPLQELEILLFLGQSMGSNPSASSQQF